MNELKVKRLLDNAQRDKMTQKRTNNMLTKEEATEAAQRNQRPVKAITITIEWKRSPTWGYCPRATAAVEFVGGGFLRTDAHYYASGYGYDKESTVIAQIFNDFLKYTLWNRENMDNAAAPYGMRFSWEYAPYFEGGVGTSCYYNISKFIGGEFVHVANGKSFDVYKFTMNEKEV